MSQNNDIELRVTTVVRDHLGVDQKKIVPDARFDTDLGADSLDRVELMMAFEEEFGIDITDEQAEKITTVGQAIEFIEAAPSA